MMSTLLIQFNLVYGSFGQSNMHSTLDFCPRLARKEANVPLYKRSKELTVLFNIYTVNATKTMIFFFINGNDVTHNRDKQF